MARVLVADDEPMSRFLLEDALNEFQHEVVSVSDGLEAWTLLQEPDAPRIAVLDWVMPGLTGVELCKRLKNRTDAPFVYVILLTGRNDKQDVVEGLDAGADDFLSKPFEPRELQSRLSVGARTIELENRARSYGEQMEALANEREIFLQAFHHSVQGIFISNPSGDILHANAAFQRTYGYDSDELVGMNYSRLNPSMETFLDHGIDEDECGRRFRDIHDSINDPERGFWRGNVLHQTKRGDVRSIELFISAIRGNNGPPLAHIGMPVDVTERTEEEHRIRLECYRALADLAEKRDNETGMHLRRVSEYSALLARQLRLSTKFVSDIQTFAPLHDIGKVGIPDNVLLAPRKLTAEEFDIIKTHATIGYEILCGRPTLEMAAEIAYSHHEKFNGKGYPQGISGKEIPLSARIIALVDVYDALRTRRPYKEAWPHERVVSLIQEESGEHFDPEIVDAFLALEKTFEQISLEYQDVLSDPSNAEST